MNKSDRKRMDEALTLLRTANELLQPLAEAEREKFDNMTEGLQNGSNGQKISEAADALENAQSGVSDAIDTLEGIE